MTWTNRQKRSFTHALLVFEAALLVCMATMHHHMARPALAMVLLGPLMLLGLLAFGMSYRLGLAKTGLAALVLQCGLVIYIFAAVYAEYGIVAPDGRLLHGRSDTLYFSVVTWTTLGYGDLHPRPELRLVAGFEALLGYVHMGLLIPFVWWMLTERQAAPPSHEVRGQRRDAGGRDSVFEGSRPHFERYWRTGDSARRGG